MKTSQILIILIVVTLAMPKSAQGQQSIFHISIQGNWDKFKQKERAQFGGDNRLISNYLASFRSELLRSGLEANGTGSISFKVCSDGKVDSLVIIKEVGSTWDSTFYSLIKSTSGKWRAGQVDGIKRNEILTIWYNVYNGPKLKEDLPGYLDLAKKSIDKADYKKALKYLDLALEYDALSVEALILKTKSLYNLKEKEKACDLIKSTLKYENEDLTGVYRELCN